MGFIYLDNNATTPVDPAVLERMQQVAVEAYGNPGSRHGAGRKARQVLEDAREQIASILGAFPDEVIFTSGGTEASNLAIRSFTNGQTGILARPPGEHPATEEVMKQLTHRGYELHTLPINRVGRLCIDQDKQLPEETRLVSVLLAHNETGTIQDLHPLAEICAQQRVPLHVDAVQAVGKLSVNFHELRATTMSLGAHKFNGPRGIGALLLQRHCKLLPEIVGGHQEAGNRAGTEPVALIAGMALALQRWEEYRSERVNSICELRDQLQSGLMEACDPAVVNGDMQNRLPNTLNISFPGCDAEASLVALDLAGVCCSHGSACASGSAEPSPILIAMGCPEEVYRSAIRFSVGLTNTQAEIERAVEIIGRIVHSLRNG